MKKINRVLLVTAVCLVLSSVFLSIEAHAAPLFKEIWVTGFYITDYDFDGDGIKDNFRLEMPNIVDLNGKKQEIISKGSIERGYYYKYNANNVFLILEVSTPNSEYAAYRYVNGKFVLASEPIGAFGNTTEVKAKGNYLEFTTGPKLLTDTSSFVHFSRLFSFTERYYVNTKKHKIVRKSNYGTITEDPIPCYYAGKKTITLSSSGKSINKKGPKLKYGQKVKLTRVYFSYLGDDASLGKKIYEVSVGSKKGWFKDSTSNKFVTYNPKKPIPDVFDLSQIVKMTELEKDSLFYSIFAKKNSGRSGKYLTYKIYTFDKIKYYDYQDKCKNPHTKPLFRFENSGSKKFSFFGVVSGMEIEEADKLLKQKDFENIKKTIDNNLYTYEFGYYNYHYELKLELNNEMITTMKAKAVLYYEDV